MSAQNLVREWRTVNTDHNIDVYVVVDRDSIMPAAIIFPEIFGVNDAMKDEAARIAQQGFSVAVPDVFWRQETRVDLG
jgi:carboxymethylenebutenolidase